jgi:hypothetical protein
MSWEHPEELSWKRQQRLQELEALNAELLRKNGNQRDFILRLQALNTELLAALVEARETLTSGKGAFDLITRMDVTIAKAEARE